MLISISQFASDPNLLNLELWPKQRQILEEFWQGNYAIAVFALGRRSGKTLMSSVVACYAGCMLADEYKRHLRRGEKFYIVSVANTIDQAKIALQGVKDLINNSLILRRLIIRETSDTLELSNGATFKALPASSRSGRGLPCPLLIFDELSHAIDTETGNAAGSSLYQALSPSVAQFGKSGKILMLSSPWIQSGIFWDLYKQARSGNFPHMYVAQAPTWEINPTISQEFLETEKARDPELFRVEFGAEFTHNIASFLDSNLVDSAVNYCRSVLRPLPEFKGKYILSLDPSKGNRDRYTACICHLDRHRLIMDLLHEFKPSIRDGNKTQVAIAEVEDWILQHNELYGFSRAVLDQYNSVGTIQRLKGKLPISELTWTSQSKTAAYSGLRELVNGGNLDLYPHNKVIQELKGLTVRYRSNGTWDVSGGSGAAVDDFASALAGCVLVAKREEPPARLPPSFVRYCSMTGRLLDYSGKSVPETLSERFERERGRLSPYEHWKRRQQQ